MRLKIHKQLQLKPLTAALQACWPGPIGSEPTMTRTFSKPSSTFWSCWFYYPDSTQFLLIPSLTKERTFQNLFRTFSDHWVFPALEGDVSDEDDAKGRSPVWRFLWKLGSFWFWLQSKPNSSDHQILISENEKTQKMNKSLQTNLKSIHTNTRLFLLLLQQLIHSRAKSICQPLIGQLVPTKKMREVDHLHHRYNSGNLVWF